MNDGIEHASAERAILREVGDALFGASWKSELANRLGITDRHLRRLLTGERAVTSEILSKLQNLCEDHTEKVAVLSARIENFQAEVPKILRLVGERMKNIQGWLTGLGHPPNIVATIERAQKFAKILDEFEHEKSPEQKGKLALEAYNVCNGIETVCPDVGVPLEWATPALVEQIYTLLGGEEEWHKKVRNYVDKLSRQGS